ncbi:MAG: hypothetical protein IKZ58_07590 [Selenomonadaceae bacterium]|nr:hypothetical protein [Selenomonadaceae bacterium]
MILIIAFILALLCAYFFRKYLIDSMSNVHLAQEAQEYLQRDTINITASTDTYLYTNITAVPKAKHHQEEDQDNDDDSGNDDNDSDSGDSDGGD